MKREDLTGLKERFVEYVDCFTTEAIDPRAYALRRDHTWRVCRETIALGLDLGLSKADLRLAEAIALLHDIGRFRQLKDYGTFVDRYSVNHARLGLKVIQEQHLLDGFDGNEKTVLEDAVACHNMARIPPDRAGRSLLFIKILRDADKLDIWKIAIETYRQRFDREFHSVFHAGLADQENFSPEIIEAIRQHCPADSRAMRCLDDFKLLQVSWIFDLNFAESLARVRKRGIIPAIFAALPKSDTMQALFDDVQRYLERGAKLISPNGFQQALFK